MVKSLLPQKHDYNSVEILTVEQYNDNHNKVSFIRHNEQLKTFSGILSAPIAQ